MSSKFSKLWQYSLKETLKDLSILTWIILFYNVIIVKAWQKILNTQYIKTELPKILSLTLIFVFIGNFQCLQHNIQNVKNVSLYVTINWYLLVISTGRTLKSLK